MYLFKRFTLFSGMVSCCDWSFGLDYAFFIICWCSRTYMITRLMFDSLEWLYPSFLYGRRRSLLIVQIPNQSLSELLIYFSQEGVDSTIVRITAQPQAEPWFQDTEILTENDIPISPMVNQKPRSNLKELVKHLGFKSPIYSHH